MMIRDCTRLPGVTAAVLVLAAAAVVVPRATASDRSAESVLHEAFNNRYDVDLTSTVELIMRDRSGREHKRIFEAASKRISGRMHSIGRLIWPVRLRGMTILTIEAEKRDHDGFVYLPSLGKSRRISTAQRGDTFFGTDATYEDLERPREDEYELAELEMGQLHGEGVYLVRGRPLRDSNYSSVVFHIAVRDAAILETRFFKRSAAAPYRVVHAPRSGMVELEGHVLPLRMLIENHVRKTTTSVEFMNLRINPAIDDGLFSVKTLEQNHRLRTQKSGSQAGADSAPKGARAD